MVVAVVLIVVFFIIITTISINITLVAIVFGAAESWLISECGVLSLASMVDEFPLEAATTSSGEFSIWHPAILIHWFQPQMGWINLLMPTIYLEVDCDCGPHLTMTMTMTMKLNDNDNENMFITTDIYSISETNARHTYIGKSIKQ